MKIFKKNENLICIYCLANQDALVTDFIAFVPNLNGVNKSTYSKTVQEHQCVECDSVLYLKMSDDESTVSVANTQQKLLA